MGRRPACSPTRRRVIGTIDCIIEIQQVFLSAEYKAEQTFFIFPARPGIFLIRYLLYLLLLFAFTHESFTSPLLKKERCRLAIIHRKAAAPFILLIIFLYGIIPAFFPFPGRLHYLPAFFLLTTTTPVTAPAAAIRITAQRMTGVLSPVLTAFPEPALSAVPWFV